MVLGAHLYLSVNFDKSGSNVLLGKDQHYRRQNTKFVRGEVSKISGIELHDVL